MQERSPYESFVQRMCRATKIMVDMNETAALRQLQNEWAEALDEGCRQEHERLLDLGWHVGPVYTLHLDKKPLVALKYMNMAVVWIEGSFLLRALDRMSAATGPEDGEEDVPWYDLGNNRFVLEVCDCGDERCGSTMGELLIMDGDLYIGLVADARGGRLRLTHPQYAFPFPIRLPLKRFYAEYAETVRLLDQQGGRKSRGADDDLPSPLVDGWVVQLKPDGNTWRSERWLAWEKEQKENPGRWGGGQQRPLAPEEPRSLEQELKDRLLWDEILKWASDSDTPD